MGFLKKVIKKINNQRPILVYPNIVEYSNEFEGKKALVIGGGTGIGLAISQELKQSGAEVVIASRKKYEIDGLTSEILDVSDISLLERQLNELIEKYKFFEIVVNSQGVLPNCDLIKDFNSIDHEDFETVMRINLESVYFITKYFCLYYALNQIEGHVLNICSTEGMKGSVVPYGISKAGVISLTQGIGKLFANKGITVNGIAPGATATDMMRMNTNEDLRKNYIPTHRANISKEVAKVAHLLLSDTGKRMCGQIVTIDGGESLK